MRQGTPQFVNRICKQHLQPLAGHFLLSGDCSSNPIYPPSLRSKASTPSPSYKNSPVTPQFFIQANVPTRLSFFGSFLAAGRPRAGCPRCMADFENIKWRGKIEKFSALFSGAGVGHA